MRAKRGKRGDSNKAWNCVVHIFKLRVLRITRKK